MALYRWLATVTLVAVCSVIGQAQTDQGKISGSVRDTSSAFVAGAKVTVKNERTGEERSAISNDQGYFLISYLKPSSYTIKTMKDGFAAVEYTAMPLAVGQELTLDFELKPAGVQESVTVVGSSPVLDISSARLGVNERTVTNWEARGEKICPRPEMQDALDTALRRASDEAKQRFELLLHTEQSTTGGVATDSVGLGEQEGSTVPTRRDMFAYLGAGLAAGLASRLH